MIACTRSAACLALLCAFSGCRRSSNAPASLPPLKLEGRGITLSRIMPEEVPRGAALRGRPGDLLLQGERFRLVIGASSTSATGELARGTLLDLTGGSWADDGLEQLRIVVVVAGRETALRAHSVEARSSEGLPFVRLLHETFDGRIRVTTDVRAMPGRPYAELVSRVENRSTSQLDVRVGERVRFSRQPIHADGLGVVAGTVRGTLTWFGSGSAEAAWGVIYPDAPAEVTFRAQTHEPQEQLALSRSTLLPAGGVLRQRRVVSTVPGDVAKLAELAWRLRGVPLGQAEGSLDPVPKWASIEARTSDGAWVVQGGMERAGRFELSLPEGTYRLRLRAPGGTDEETVQIKARTRTGVHFLVPTPRRLTYRVLEGVESIPARLVIRGIPPTADPELGPPHSAAGAGNVTYTASGAGAVELPPGRYRVLATRGVEYTIAEKDVDVTAELGEAARFQLSRIVDTRGWLACDFHLHADPSGDSEVPLADRITSLLAEGIEYAAATDHNVVTDYAPAIAALDAGARIASTPGVEITTEAWGHFNAYPYDRPEPPPYTGVTPGELFGAVRKTAPRALIQINHPRMGDIGYFNQSRLDARTGASDAGGFSFDFDVIEVLNGFEHELPTIERNLSDWYGLLNLGRRYTAVGNSDSHRLVTQWAGYPRTFVQVSPDQPGDVTEEQIREALRRGRAFVTTGPFLELRAGGRGLGEVARAAQARVAVELLVRAPPWVAPHHARLVINGQVVQDVVIPAAPAGAANAFAYRTDLPVERDGWLVAVVWGDAPLTQVLAGTKVRPFAFTNPIFLDGDGDGVTRFDVSAGLARDR